MFPYYAPLNLHYLKKNKKNYFYLILKNALQTFMVYNHNQTVF